MDAAVPKTMKAAQVVEHGKPIKVHEIPVPEPGPSDVLVKIEASGVCHTDLHVMDGDWKYRSAVPITPGHEGVGRVVKLGSLVKNLKLGDRVGIPWLHRACSHCMDCLSGWETVCTDQKNTGFTVNGGFAQYAVADAAYAARIPDALSNEQAAPVLCAGVTVYKGLKETAVRPGQSVVITGAGGGLGHLAVQYAKAMGMTVIGIDGGEAKMAFLKRLGADHTIDFQACKDVVAEVKRLTRGEGAHGALMLAAVRQAITEAVYYLRPRGTVVCISLPPGDLSASIIDVVLKAVSIKGSIVGTRFDMQEALAIAAEGKVKCNVTMRKMDEINAIMEDLRAMRIEGRVVLAMED